MPSRPAANGEVGGSIRNKNRRIAVSGKQTGGHDGDLKAVLADLEKAAVAVVHVGIVDLDGGFRERRFRLAELREFADGGTFVNVLLQWDIAVIYIRRPKWPRPGC